MMRKPTALKVLQGNPGKRPLPENEPKFDITVPKAPEFLYGESLRQWNIYAPLLASKGLMSDAFITELSNYCLCVQEIAEATEDIKENGYTETTTNGNVIQRPVVGLRHQAMDRAHKFLVEFGMTPASATKITASKKDADDEFGDFD